LRGEGVYLYDFDGNRYLDAISSWWVNLFGTAIRASTRACMNSWIGSNTCCWQASRTPQR